MSKKGGIEEAFSKAIAKGSASAAAPAQNRPPKQSAEVGDRLTVMDSEMRKIREEFNQFREDMVDRLDYMDLSIEGMEEPGMEMDDVPISDLLTGNRSKGRAVAPVGVAGDQEIIKNLQRQVLTLISELDMVKAKCAAL